jgi:hypothetical protein
MPKTPSSGVRVQLKTKAALEKAARDDLRSVSSLIEKVLVEWLREKGYLPTSQLDANRVDRAASDAKVLANVQIDKAYQNSSEKKSTRDRRRHALTNLPPRFGKERGPK